MTSISSILSAAACFNLLLCSAIAADNYSLWPRRPAELEQARRLVREQKGAEAVHLLQPFIHDNGIAGREARQITGSVNVQRYLSRRHPDARVYTVKPGDNVFKIAAAEKCTVELILLLNGIVEPSGLRVGQKLVLVPMNCCMEIRPNQREVCVWDRDVLVADYTMISGDFQRKGEVALCLQARDGYMNGSRLPARSLQFLASDRVLVLSDGLKLIGEHVGSSGNFRMKQQDLNELALLLGPQADVTITQEEKK